MIEFVSKILMVPRWSLHIVASRKGMAIGQMSYVQNNAVKDLSSSSVNIPSNLDTISEFQINADFVLIVEKDTIFEQLVAEKAHLELN